MFVELSCKSNACCRYLYIIIHINISCTYAIEQVIVRAPTPGSVSQVDIQVTNSNDSLTLHWGGIRKKKEYVQL